MQKLKPMLPTLRERKRYIVYEVLSKENIGDVSKEVLESIRNALGVFDSAEAGIVPVEFDSKKQIGIMKVQHTSVDKVRSAMIMNKKLNGKSAIIRVTNVSGTLKNARNKGGK